VGSRLYILAKKKDKLTTNIKRYKITVFGEGTSLFNWVCAIWIIFTHYPNKAGGDARIPEDNLEKFSNKL
jgi:hypothetical protein